ncbi:MAG: hypothetical protein R2708_12180 [Vicinamibacterales bacterium]
MRALIVVGTMLAFVTAPLAAQTAPTELRGFVVAVSETSVTVSNVPLKGLGSPPPAGGGGTFTMPRPKPGDAPPTWVTADPTTSAGETADPSAAAPTPRMVMMAPDGAGGTVLELTEIGTTKGAVKAADYPAGTAVTVTYRVADGRKVLEKIEKAAPQP